MSPENVDALRPIYDEWGRGNFLPTFDLYDAQMEWGWSDELPGLAACTATLSSATTGCMSG